jgi:hypothetical protein
MLNDGARIIKAANAKTQVALTHTWSVAVIIAILAEDCVACAFVKLSLPSPLPLADPKKDAHVPA